MPSAWGERSRFRPENILRRRIPIPSTFTTKASTTFTNKMLYDMSADPAQKKDVAGAHPEVVSRLTAVLRETEAKNDTRQERFIIGSDKHNPVEFNPSSWSERVSVWQKGIRTAIPIGRSPSNSNSPPRTPPAPTSRDRLARCRRPPAASASGSSTFSTPGRNGCAAARAEIAPSGSRHAGRRGPRTG